MVQEGMDAMRINMSHGDYKEHGMKIELWRDIAPDRPIIADLTGPSIRVVADAPLSVSEGQRVVIGEDFRLSKDISHAVIPGDTVLVDDGKVRLEVDSVSRGRIEAVVTVGGEIKPGKSVNVPGADVYNELPTEKDMRDIKWALDNEVDLFFASFVSKPSDVLAVREFIREQGSDAWVFAKIESAKGVENVERILRVADGVVVARGDLGVEIPVESVPSVQKRIIATARRVGRSVVVATQMLSSMVNSPFPTRAEVSDVANAVFDGASALMVSNETAVGKYPVEVIRVLSRIILANQDDVVPVKDVLYEDDADAIALSALHLADRMGAPAIVAPTSSGRTPRKLARFRPAQRIVAVTADKKLLRRLHLVYGVDPRFCERPMAFSTFGSVVDSLRSEGILSDGDAVVCANVSSPDRSHTIRVVRA